MVSAYQSSSVRRRPVALGLAIAAHALVIALLFLIAPKVSPPPPRDPEPKTFTLSPAPAPAPAPAPKAGVAKPKVAAEKAAKAAAPTAASVPPPPPVPAPKPLKMMPNGMELFDAVDIGKMGTRGTEGTGKDSAAVYGPGEGPGGQRLYDVDWYRRPTNAELSGYLPPNAPREGYALIACRMVEDYQVENCRALAESPVGSGFARAMRQAAWQFRVIPPRLGNKKILGTWVRIRIEFGKGS